MQGGGWPRPAPGLTATQRTASAPQLRVMLQGQGTPVLLSHALGVDLQLWDGLAATLAAAGCEVARYDHRGHGASEVPPGPYAMDQLVHDAARVIAEWGRGPVVFVGLSMGGMVAQGLAIRHPRRLRGMVVANSSAQFSAAARAAWAERVAAVQAGGMAAVAGMLMERWFTAGFRAAQPAMVQRCREAVLRCDPAGYVAACQAVAALDWLDRLHEVPCPTLVLAGAQDAANPPAMAQAMVERIPGAALEVFDDAAHLSVLEQPERFARSVLAFIERHGR